MAETRDTILTRVRPGVRDLVLAYQTAHDLPSLSAAAERMLLAAAAADPRTRAAATAWAAHQVAAVLPAPFNRTEGD